MNRQEVVVWQQTVLWPLLSSESNRVMINKSWDWAPHSVGWQDMSDDEAQPYLDFFGSAAFKILRFTKFPVDKVKKCWLEGGSCLLSTADTNLARNSFSPRNPATGQEIRLRSRGDIKELLSYLPNLGQLADAVLPLPAGKASMEIIYVGEDSLFADRVSQIWQISPGCVLPDMFDLVYRVSNATSRWLAHIAGGQYPVKPVHFSRLSQLTEQKNEFMTSPDFLDATKSVGARHGLGKIISLDLSKVLYTYTQHWAENILVPGGYLSLGSGDQFIIAEPFHHFSLKKKTGTDVDYLLAAFTQYFQDHPFGVKGSKNELVSIVGFMPCITTSGTLAFESEPTSEQLNRQNYPDVLEEWHKSINNPKKVFPLSKNPVYVAAVNLLYFQESCREFMLRLSCLDECRPAVKTAVKQVLNNRPDLTIMSIEENNLIRQEIVGGFADNPAIVERAQGYLRLLFVELKRIILDIYQRDFPDPRPQGMARFWPTVG